MKAPIETLDVPLYFTDGDRKFKRVAPDKYVEKTESGEVEVSKQTSNVLMDALIGGDVITEESYNQV